MRTIWTGSISFGLVNIPVRLYSASASEDKITFDLLHKKDNAPIRYAKICTKEEKEVQYQDTSKAYEYEKGLYVVLSQNDFEKANVKKTKTINIQGFVKEDEVDGIFYDKPYFLEPGKGAEKAYALLREALKKTKKVAVSKYVLRDRENLALVKAKGDLILLNQLRYDYELRSPGELQLPKTENITQSELEMAMALINQQTKQFNPKDFKDTYREELKKLIEAKAEGKIPVVKEKEPEPTKVRDLMDLLKKSLEQEQKMASP